MKIRKWTKWTEKVQVCYARCGVCGERAIPNRHASFTASKLYAPGVTVVELARKWNDSKDDPESKQTFYNTILGEAYQAQALKKIDTTGLAERMVQFAAEVPEGVVALTAGVDVQPGSEGGQEGRLEVEVVGWGPGYESWSVAHEVLVGDPGKPDVWAALDELLLKRWRHERGADMVIRATCVDSGGHNTEDVYKFCRARVARNVWAIKGASDRSGEWSPVWPIPKQDVKKTKRTGYKPIIIGVNSAKEFLRQRLLIDEPGPGYCHFPIGRPVAWFEQLTSEDLVLETRHGTKVRKWMPKKGRANEALDTRVYAYAALCGLEATRRLNLNRLAELMDAWSLAPRPAPDRVRTVPATDEEKAALVAETAERLDEALRKQKAPVPQPQRQTRVRRSSWMNR